ncbi:Vacuolar morphogenesis protein 6 [Cyphellophora attinorum]|uniref:Vacuolar morphogenesis protein 6 n=1 Tax=Cyphellophora attinorum TaxID=1664694 RepID=A0A0N1NVG2_9EURO|nr:Vacuolar morphogenesis protein 6 [Phialophora attinorum]KPI34657.1 Vacuolar morphogenesis protein 6 [Phialophora attinorum]
MLEAFTAQPIVELKQRDKSKIECILSHSDQLLVGLNTGSLRIYRVNAPSTPANGTSDNAQAKKPSELLREYERFAKYKIEQLAIFREANVLISLSNGLISLHELGTYELQEQLAKTKGASSFAVTSNIVKDESTGIPTLVSRLAVAVKRRILLWEWHEGELTSEHKEIALPSTIKLLLWATGTTIIAGLNTHYELVDISNENSKTIIGPGSIGGQAGQDSSRLGGTMSYIGMGSMVPDPLASGLSEKEMLLAKDINTHFIDRNGEPLNRRQIPWKTAPQAIGYSYPYLLALTESAKGVLEVRNPVTLTVLQSIDLPGANRLQVPNPNISLAHQGKGFLVASERAVWRMQGLKYDAQVDALVEANQLDEAISLLDLVEDTLIEDKDGRLREIKMKKAQRLFDDKKFRDSLDLFGEVSAPPERVIKLYPKLIAGSLAAEPESKETRQDTPKKSHKKSVSVLSGSSKDDAADAASVLSTKPADDEGWSEKELKTAVRELQAFLADVRRRLQRFFNPDQSVKSLTEVQELFNDEDVRQMVEYLLGVSSLDDVDLATQLTTLATQVDTTLFRAHMFATPSLAGSLFRIANFCDPEVVIDRLEESKRYSELIDFLYGKKLHQQALERLQKFGKSSEDDEVDENLRGPARTVSYLGGLPSELIDLILEFSKWPLSVDAKLGMEVFTADTENAETLDRGKVLSFLKSIDQNLAQRYLEHVVDEWNDLTPSLHQELLSIYLSRLKAGEHDAELLERFLTMLQNSTQYSAAKVLNELPKDDANFYEARAILFSKMGNHKQALEMYVFKINDNSKAEEYCNKVYLDMMSESPKPKGTIAAPTADPMDEDPSIYHLLLNLYLNPPKGETSRYAPAIELMAKHGARLPASSTLELIPPELLVRELEFYFRGRMRNANTILNESMVAAGLRKVDAVRVQAALQLGQGSKYGGRSRKVRIDEERVCGVCHKRLGGSVISVFPDNSVVHLGCAARKTSVAAQS